jgi:hypothetical protein
LETRTDDPEALVSWNAQAGLTFLEGEAALKEAKAEVVPENAENAFAVAVRYRDIEFQPLILQG